MSSSRLRRSPSLSSLQGVIQASAVGREAASKNQRLTVSLSASVHCGDREGL
ncbi:hypothetical protein H6G89_12980 [Oscillatoria sp. FACHB-1407]|uniref:hypothetical protein n=1 Tax=Oscillatoria sp. FACHB-1407 TaxID=2692847 RepID=UPI0016840206|nr:hypothetical protein [Oscillatoria sp. FACHB-1407]MBD2461961.1 hypothetical protein [Oscillatoria sp. FACHB-1407]